VCPLAMPGGKAALGVVAVPPAVHLKVGYLEGRLRGRWWPAVVVVGLVVSVLVVAVVVATECRVRVPPKTRPQLVVLGWRWPDLHGGAWLSALLL